MRHKQISFFSLDSVKFVTDLMYKNIFFCVTPLSTYVRVGTIKSDEKDCVQMQETNRMRKDTSISLKLLISYIEKVLNDFMIFSPFLNNECE